MAWTSTREDLVAETLVVEDVARRAEQRGVHVRSVALTVLRREVVGLMVEAVAGKKEKK